MERMALQQSGRWGVAEIHRPPGSRRTFGLGYRPVRGERAIRALEGAAPRLGSCPGAFTPWIEPRSGPPKQMFDPCLAHLGDVLTFRFGLHALRSAQRLWPFGLGTPGAIIQAAAVPRLVKQKTMGDRRKIAEGRLRAALQVPDPARVRGKSGRAFRGSPPKDWASSGVTRDTPSPAASTASGHGWWNVLPSNGRTRCRRRERSCASRSSWAVPDHRHSSRTQLCPRRLGPRGVRGRPDPLRRCESQTRLRGNRADHPGLGNALGGPGTGRQEPAAVRCVLPLGVLLDHHVRRGSPLLRHPSRERQDTPPGAPCGCQPLGRDPATVASTVGSSTSKEVAWPTPIDPAA